MNEVMNAILTRRSIRKFTDAPIPRDILEELVNAGLHAPSGKGRQTWKFTVITNRDMIARLTDLIGSELARENYDMYRPTAIIMATVKGKGLSVAEGKLSSHNMPLSPEDVAAALQELQ